MEFFRKYQRIILYTAGIFALVSFSISGPILQFFGNLSSRAPDLPSMQVAGKTIGVTQEDQIIAQRLVARIERGDLVVVLPPLFDPEGNDSKVDVLAALRRLSIEAGIDYSEDEVRRAIDTALQIGNPFGRTSVGDLWKNGLYGSERDYVKVLGEAMRIATFVRLQALGIDTTTASIAAKLGEDVETVTLLAAMLDEKAIQTAFEEADVTDEDLQAWIDGLEKPDQNARGFLDQNRYRVEVASLELAAFDPASFAEELGDRTFSDDEVSQFYEINKFRLYQKERAPDATDDAPVEYQELDDPMKESIRQRLQAESVLRSLWDGVTARLTESVKAENEAVAAALAKVDEAVAAVGEAAAKAAAEGATDADREAVTAAEAAVTAAKAEVESANTALATKRADFDVAAAFGELGKGRAGLAVTDSGEDSLNTTQLVDLEPVAPWTGSAAVAALSMAQPLTTQVQRSLTHSFYLRLRALDETPLKKLEDIRDKARADWFSMKTLESVDSKTKAFEEALKVLSRGKITEEIAELETERDTKLDSKVAEWQADLDGKLAEARTQRDFHRNRDPLGLPLKVFQKEVERLEAELTTLDAVRTGFLEELQKETDAAIEKAARTHYAEVLAEAAAAQGFVVETYGPYPRNLFAAGRAREAFAEPVRYLWGQQSVSGLKVGEASDVLKDFQGRKQYLAVATAAEKGSLGDITRRGLLDARESGARDRMTRGLMQSFSKAALEQRYGWKQPSAKEIVPGVPKDQ